MNFAASSSKAHIEADGTRKAFVFLLLPGLYNLLFQYDDKTNNSTPVPQLSPQWLGLQHFNPRAVTRLRAFLNHWIHFVWCVDLEQVMLTLEDSWIIPWIICAGSNFCSDCAKMFLTSPRVEKRQSVWLFIPTWACLCLRESRCPLNHGLPPPIHPLHPPHHVTPLLSEYVCVFVSIALTCFVRFLESIQKRNSTHVSSSRQTQLLLRPQTTSLCLKSFAQNSLGQTNHVSQHSSSGYFMLNWAKQLLVQSSKAALASLLWALCLMCFLSGLSASCRRIYCL